MTKSIAIITIIWWPVKQPFRTCLNLQFHLNSVQKIQMEENICAVIKRQSDGSGSAQNTTNFWGMFSHASWHSAQRISLVIHVHKFTCLCLWIYVKAMRRMEEDSGSLLLLKPGPCLSVWREVLMLCGLAGGRPQGIVASQIWLKEDLFPKNCDRPWSKNLQLGGRVCFRTWAFISIYFMGCNTDVTLPSGCPWRCTWRGGQKIPKVISHKSLISKSTVEKCMQC